MVRKCRSNFDKKVGLRYHSVGLFFSDFWSIFCDVFGFL
nr:MAG TPA: hypothetical protein [Caudoviricetes sp.]